MREASQQVDETTGYVRARTSEIEALLGDKGRARRVKDSVRGLPPLHLPDEPPPTLRPPSSRQHPPPLPREEPPPSTPRPPVQDFIDTVRTTSKATKPSR